MPIQGLRAQPVLQRWLSSSWQKFDFLHSRYMSVDEQITDFFYHRALAAFQCPIKWWNELFLWDPESYPVFYSGTNCCKACYTLKNNWAIYL